MLRAISNKSPALARQDPEGAPSAPVAVNVSALQLDVNLPGHVRSALQRHGLNLVGVEAFPVPLPGVSC